MRILVRRRARAATATARGAIKRLNVLDRSVVVVRGNFVAINAAKYGL